jgi:hypothetical protein
LVWIIDFNSIGLISVFSHHCTMTLAVIFG